MARTNRTGRGRRGRRHHFRLAGRDPWDPMVLLAVLVVAGLGAFGGSLLINGEQTRGAADDEVMAAEPVSTLDEPALRELGEAVAAALRGEPVPVEEPAGRLGETLGPAFVGLRTGGERVAWAWGEGDTALTTVLDAIAQAKSVSEGAELDAVDAVDVCLTHSYRDVDLDGDSAGLLTNLHRGVLGMEIELEGRNGRYSPTLMLASNMSFERAMQHYADSLGIAPGDLRSDAARLRSFSCDQLLVHLEDPPRVTPMFRGNEVVDLEHVTAANVERLADRMGAWLEQAVHEDGRMTYTYWPSRGEESSANNMIRQWMATNALIQLGRARGDDELLALARRNIDHNLATFYESDGDLGLIAYDDKVKLGAVALAALALLEHPDGHAFTAQREALDRTIDHLWRPDGSFRTFYRPSDRNDNQNFYPGEALLYWAIRYDRDPDPALLDRFMTSFRHYRAWHLDEDNRNPAFVPWHTQAYYRVWQRTQDPELRDFIFEMNDWLLQIQQWDDVLYPDIRGRFYDAQGQRFGPPHASSTGVYLEGLADAYALARELDDTERADRYRLAIRRGLRSILQLQFADEVDLFYISKRDRAFGGIRTTVYDNAIRVDNVQHTLLAVLKVLETFEPSEYIR